MSKQGKKKRWRDVKSHHGFAKPLQTRHNSPWIALSEFSLRGQLRTMRASERIKAFITDMFMINMPLLYLCTYVFLDGREDFQQNHTAIFACVLLYGVILSLFFALSSQTPGYRYMGLKLVRYGQDSAKSEDFSESSIDSEKVAQKAQKDGQKVGFVRAFARYVLWVFGASFLLGILIGLVRRDGRCLHDIICGTDIVSIPNGLDRD